MENTEPASSGNLVEVPSITARKGKGPGKRNMQGKRRSKELEGRKGGHAGKEKMGNGAQILLN